MAGEKASVPDTINTQERLFTDYIGVSTNRYQGVTRITVGEYQYQAGEQRFINAGTNLNAEQISTMIRMLEGALREIQTGQGRVS